MRELDAKAADIAEAVLKAAGSKLAHYEAYSRKRIIEATRDALNALPPQQEGWRLVPVEPTNEMIGAGLAERDRPGSGHAVSLIYGAMLAAAPLPTPPAPQDQQ